MQTKTELPMIRRLWPADQEQISAHFASLDAGSLNLRFGGGVSDEFVRDYARRILEIGSAIYGAFPDDRLRAVGELRGVLDGWPATAEAAFSVQPAWQDQGLGEALMTRIIAAAQNRGIKSLHMICLKENRKMQHLAEKHDAVLSFHPAEVTASLDPPWPTPFSVAEELTGEARGFVRAVMNWPG
ncbi:MAG: GNAT family N-acetyltransferase [Pseudomonadota bacterium]